MRVAHSPPEFCGALLGWACGELGAWACCMDGVRCGSECGIKMVNVY